jgi:hypothetical protein
MASRLARFLNSAVEMQLVKVRGTDGSYLGRAYDFRCRWTPGQTEPPVVEEVVYGRRGLLWRVGFHHLRDETLPWSAVQSIDNGVMTVDPAQARPPRD